MLQRDPIARAVYTITANNEQQACASCLATCAKYMENIVGNPSEDKYRRIRMGNKVFQVCVRVCFSLCVCVCGSWSTLGL